MSEEKPHFIEQVVGPNDLYNQTSVGWEVVERFDHDEPIRIEEPPTEEMRRTGCYTHTVRTLLGRVSSFRIKRALDSPIATLTEQVQTLHLQIRTDAEEKRKAEEALEAEKKKHQATKSELTRAREYTEMQRKEREQIEAIKRQLERDLGRVREHIGRKLFDEILPPQPKQEGSP